MTTSEKQGRPQRGTAASTMVLDAERRDAFATPYDTAVPSQSRGGYAGVQFDG